MKRPSPKNNAMTPAASGGAGHHASILKSTLRKAMAYLLPTAIALTFTLAGALYAQSRDRSRNSRSSDRSDRAGYSRFNGTSSEAPTSSTRSLSSSSYSASAEALRPGRPLSGDFEILSKKSIFSKDRRPGYDRWSSHPPETARAETSTPPRAPAVPVLVGVLLGDDEYLAYIEDPDSGKLWPFAAGDPLPQDFGNVYAVSLDDITIEKPGAPNRRVLIGQNLAGQIPSSTPSYSPSSSSSSSSTQPTTAPIVDTGNLTIEQKMKLRRQQQMGQ